MTRNELKDRIQEQSVLLAKKHQYYIAEFATGIGKSLTFIKIMEELGGEWNLVVAETNHMQNWKDEFKKHGKSKLLKKVNIFCYASLHKNIDAKNYCFDEIHHLSLSDRRLNLLREIKASNLKRIIGLSATINNRQKGNLNSILSNIYYHRISISDAINNDILPEPKVYLIPILLDTTLKNQTFNWSKDKSKICTQQEWYNLQCNRIEYFKDVYLESRTEWDRRKWMLAGSKRKKFLADVKTPYAKELLTKLKDKRLICFTHSIEQSEILSKGNSIHSNISADLRKEMIEDFNTGKIDKLFTTKMLREGMNLNNIEVGIMVQLDNNLKSLVQSLGRVLRSSYPEYYILYVKNTQDQVYLDTALEGFNSDYIIKTNLNEL